MIYYLFLEGDKDELLFNAICKKNLIKIIKYARKKSEYVDKYIESINNWDDAAYYIVADTDDRNYENTIEKILVKFKQCKKENIVLVEKEIESWVLAGIDDEKCKKMKIKCFLNTDNISKEQFEIMFNKKEPYSLIIELMSDFNSKVACGKNHTYNEFYTTHSHLFM